MTVIISSHILHPTDASIVSSIIDTVVDVVTPERDARVTDSILTDTAMTITEGLHILGETLIEMICNAFNPSVNALINLEQGNNFTIADEELLDEAGVENSYIIMIIWEFAFKFGYITATFIALFSAGLIIFGQQDFIKDTGGMILAKYFVSMFMIYMSKDFMQVYLDLFENIWENFIIKSDTSTVSYSQFVPVSLVADSDYVTYKVLGIPIKIHDMEADAVSGAAGKQILEIITDTIEKGILAHSFACGIPILVIAIIAIYLGYKLIKEFIKLFLEVIERYFVLMFLIAFFPAIASTFTSNNSKKIFFAYFKMIYTQAFLLMVNSIFMTIFFRVLVVNGWTEGFLNYLCALAFLRICQRFDSYMGQMGFGIIQTGMGFMNSVGGFAGSSLAAMTALRTFDRGRQNVGKALLNRGISGNNFGETKIGNILAGSIPQVMSGGIHDSTTLSQIHTERVSDNAAALQNGSGQYRETNVSGSANMNEMLQKANISTSLADKLESAGITHENVATVKQMDHGATTFAMMNQDGNTLATIKNNEIYKSPNAEDVQNDKKLQRNEAIKLNESKLQDSQKQNVDFENKETKKAESDFASAATIPENPLAQKGYNLADAEKSISDIQAQSMASRYLENSTMKANGEPSIGGSLNQNAGEAKSIELLPNSESQNGNALYSNVDDNAGTYRANARITSLDGKGNTITQQAHVEIRDTGIDASAHTLSSKQGWQTYAYTNEDGTKNAFKIKVTTQDEKRLSSGSPVHERKNNVDNTGEKLNSSKKPKRNSSNENMSQNNKR